VTDAETRLTKAIALKPTSGMALVPVDAVTEVLASLATLRAENARLPERDAQPARLGGTSN
jgi:hypothetical protein